MGIYKFFTFLFIITISSPLFAQGLSNKDMLSYFSNNSRSKIKQIVLPIVESKNIRLLIKVPENFKMIERSNIDFMEFIPLQESPFSYSEILTINFFKGHRIRSNSFIENFINQISKLASETKIYYNNSKEDNTLNAAEVMLEFEENNVRHLLKLIIIAGPYDSVCVQKDIPLLRGKSIDQAKIEIEKFFNENLTLLNKDKESL